VLPYNQRLEESMKKKQSIESSQESPDEPNEAEGQSIDEAANAKAEELRAAMQSKSEQGQSTLGSLPIREKGKDKKRKQ
jgi:hypothetical protein